MVFLLFILPAWVSARVCIARNQTLWFALVAFPFSWLGAFMLWSTLEPRMPEENL